MMFVGVKALVNEPSDGVYEENFDTDPHSRFS